MIDIYKIGKKYYDEELCGKDKNSGIFEYDIIRNELKGIETELNVLIIINGKLEKQENDFVLNKMKGYDKTIFIMSDSIALKTCKQIMNKCTLVLHQRIFGLFKEITTKQAYSGVPELFYKYCIIPYDKIDFQKKKNKISFGGNDLNRRDKFEAYNINLDNKKFSVRIKSYEDNTDGRVSHDEYLEELKNCKHSLMICRKEYRNINWITARFFESIAVGTIPICDVDFCNGIGTFIPILPRVKNESELQEFTNKYSDETTAKVYIEKAHLACDLRTEIFKNAIIAELNC